jgi:hypothetical protein
LRIDDEVRSAIEDEVMLKTPDWMDVYVEQ